MGTLHGPAHMMEYDAAVRKLESLANPEGLRGMARFGITARRTCRVSIPDQRKLAKQIWKRNAR